MEGLPVAVTRIVPTIRGPGGSGFDDGAAVATEGAPVGGEAGAGTSLQARAPAAAIPASVVDRVVRRKISIMDGSPRRACQCETRSTRSGEANSAGRTRVYAFPARSSCACVHILRDDGYDPMCRLPGPGILAPMAKPDIADLES